MFGIVRASLISLLLISSIMKVVTLFAVLLVLAAAGFPHVLQKIEVELKAVQSAYKLGEYSQAFSRLMVVKLELDELH